MTNCARGCPRAGVLAVAPLAPPAAVWTWRISEINKRKRREHEDEADRSLPSFGTVTGWDDGEET
jgi:hypothetical protein